MNLLDWLDQLREKPESVRFRVAILIAFVSTFIIFLVWLSVLFLRFDEKKVNVEVTATEIQSPFLTFKNGMSRTLEDGRNLFVGLKDSLKDIEYQASDSNEGSK